MIVRLKGRYRELLQRAAPEFQFYDSPIKRSKWLSGRLRPIRYFNSMIVRLKVSNDVSGFSSNADFNSMIVRLKAVRNDKKHY